MRKQLWGLMALMVILSMLVGACARRQPPRRPPRRQPLQPLPRQPLPRLQHRQSLPLHLACRFLRSSKASSTSA